MVSMPSEFKVLHVDMDSQANDMAAIWIEFDTSKTKTRYTNFSVFNTGADLPDNDKLIHVGSVRHPLPSGVSMWHVYREE